MLLRGCRTAQEPLTNHGPGVAYPRAIFASGARMTIPPWVFQVVGILNAFLLVESIADEMWFSAALGAAGVYYAWKGLKNVT